MTGTAIAFVDRDGVINDLVPDPATGRPESPLDPGDVALMAGAAEALRLLHERGYLLAGVSNQPAAAKGRVSLAQLQAVQRRVEELLADEGVAFDAFELCFHHPDGEIPELSGGCDCRKPAPGMLLRAASALGGDMGRSWMFGDTDTDAQAAEAAGCEFIQVTHPGSDHKRKPETVGPRSAANLTNAVAMLLAAGDHSGR